MNNSKLSREKEMSYLLPILQDRIEILSQDPRFEARGMDGTEVRMCMLASVIYKSKKENESYADTALQVINKKISMPESFVISTDNLALAIELAEALEIDAENGIDPNVPNRDKYPDSLALLVRCSATNDYGKDLGKAAQPRDLYIKQFMAAQLATV